MKNTIIAALIVAVAIVAGFYVSKDVIQYGASSGPEHFNREYFFAGLVQGGGEVTKTANSTTSISAADVCGYSIISWAAGVVAASATLPTAATLTNTCLPRTGDFKDVIFNNTGLAASTTAFATTTGLRLFIEDDTGADALIAGKTRGLLRFLRSDEGSSTTVDVFLVDQLAQ